MATHDMTVLQRILFFLCISCASLHAESPMPFEQVGHWPTSGNEVFAIENKGKMLYVASFNDQSDYLHVIDASDPANLKVLKSFPIGLIRGLSAKGDRLYITSAFHYVYDTSDSGNPILRYRSMNSTHVSGKVEVFPLPLGAAWTSGVIDVFGSGFPLYRDSSISSLHASNDYLYAADQTNGLVILDWEDDTYSRLTKIGEALIPGGSDDVRVLGNTAVLRKERVLTFVDVTQKDAPSIITNLFTPGDPREMEPEGSFLYVALDSSGIYALDCSNPARPVAIGKFNTAGRAFDLCVNGDYVYVADGTNGVVVLKQSLLDIQPLTILSSPTNQTVTKGTSLELTIEAVSSFPIKYSWYDSLPSGKIGTNSTLTITNVNRSHQGEYFAWVSDGMNLIQTPRATIRVIGGLVLSPSTNQPLEFIISAPDGPVTLKGGALPQVLFSPNLRNWYTYSTPLSPTADGQAYSFTPHVRREAYFRVVQE